MLLCALPLFDHLAPPTCPLRLIPRASRVAPLCLLHAVPYSHTHVQPLARPKSGHAFTAHQSKLTIYLSFLWAAISPSGRAIFGVGLGGRVANAGKIEEHMFISTTVYGRGHAGSHEAQLGLYGAGVWENAEKMENIIAR